MFFISNEFPLESNQLETQFFIFRAKITEKSPIGPLNKVPKDDPYECKNSQAISAGQALFIFSGQ